MNIVNFTSFPVEALPVMNHEGNPVVVVVVKGTFDVSASGVVTPSDKQIPVTFGDELPEAEKGHAPKWESDVVSFKPKTDVVLVGRATAPGGRPAPWVDATLRVGPVGKSLRVFGERKWVCNGKKLTAAMTHPLPFVTMDIVQERAFGGMDVRTGGTCAENPAGRGYFDQENVDEPEKTFLPNVEDPKALIRHWKDHPTPAGFGVVAKGAPSRTRHLGTFDERWEKERSPAPPADARPDFHNAAQPDLQVPGFLKGNEEAELVNLTPGGVLRFRLPGVRPTVTVTRADIELLGWEAPTSTEAIEMRLDTLCLLPEENRFFLVWRGSCPVKNLGALEIREVAVTT
jgi:hypothetical protein